MLRYTAVKISIVGVMLGLGGCLMSASKVSDVESTTSSTDPKPAPAPAPMTSPVIQKKVIAQFQKGDSQELFGLFSESGMADQGQIIVEIIKPGQSQLTYYEPAKKSPEPTATLTKTQLKAFKKGIAIAKKLGDYNPPSFDGVDFEFIHLKRSGRKAKLIRRIFMHNPGVIQPAPDYEQLIDAFQKLVAEDRLQHKKR